MVVGWQAPGSQHDMHQMAFGDYFMDIMSVAILFFIGDARSLLIPLSGKANLYNMF